MSRATGEIHVVTVIRGSAPIDEFSGGQDTAVEYISIVADDLAYKPEISDELAFAGGDTMVIQSPRGDKGGMLHYVAILKR